MLFNSLTFFLFYLVVAVLYFRLPRRRQNILILMASAMFYGTWDYRFLVLMAISITTDFCAAQAISRTTNQRRKKTWLIFSVVVNLGILGFFKYFNFFVGSFERLLEMVGLPFLSGGLYIVLPVGISFYTFQSMSYTIDVYRDQLKPTRRFIDYAAFVSFFPQLVAGPIERAAHLLPQFQQPRRLAREQLSESLWLIVWGLFKKIVIADNLAAMVDPIFAWNEPLSGGMVLIGLYAFAMQIYCDFSGYSDMARGLAGCLGFKLMYNFRLPYFSLNPQMFWRRWHVSLSTWLRDYLYLSLGGNRGGRMKTYRNLMVTMLLGGLWHGAAWTFVFWGAYQGAILVLHRWSREWRNGPDERILRIWSKLVRWFIMVQVICFGWLLFRADSMFQVWTFTRTLATDFTMPSRAWGHVVALLLLCLPLWLVEVLQERKQDLKAPLQLPVPVKAVFIGLITVLMLGLGNTGTQQFIYFQF